MKLLRIFATMAAFVASAAALAADPPFTYRSSADIGGRASFGIFNDKCVDPNGVPYQEPYTDVPYWDSPPSQPPSVTLSHSPAQLMTNVAEWQYFQTTKDTPAGDYKIHWNTKDSVHCNNWYWDWIVTIQPVLTTKDFDIWWFDGEQPASYVTKTTLTATGPGPYAWKIVGGATFAEFDNHSATITTTGNTTTVLAKAPSALPSDVKMTVTENGIESRPAYLSVRSPKMLLKLPSIHRTHALWVYKTFVIYKLFDNLNREFPETLLPCNEKFTSAVINDPPTANYNWVRGPNGGGENCDPRNFADRILGQPLDSHDIPMPLEPADPLGMFPVHHFSGGWRIGSSTVGKGTLVQTNDWQRYQDHAEHTKITSPVN